MKHTASPVAGALALLGFVGQSLAQTPPGLSPAISQSLSVSFGNTLVTAGNSLLLEETQVSPAVSLPALSTNTSAHVLLMVDFDAPGGINGNKTLAPFLHWLAPIAASSSAVPGNQTAASDIAPYVGPAPPVGSGKHRYVLMLFSAPSREFQWPSSLPAFDATKLESRVQFAIETFAEAGGLGLVAANWFTTENTTAVYTAGGPGLGGHAAPVAGGAAAAVSLLLAAL